MFQIIVTFLCVLISWNALHAESLWPQFRGPTGQGHANLQSELPVSWSETENIAWKIPVEGVGWSSPVIAGEQLWLTTAVDDGKSLRALCFETTSGRKVHDIEVVAGNKPKGIHKKNSHASPTPWIDDERVYVHFGTYGTACIQRVSGEILWKKQLEYNPFHGPGGSPVVFEDLLIVNCDGSDVQFVIALNKMTGEEVWRTKRAHISEARKSGAKMPGMAFSTPLITRDGDRDVVLSAGGDHIAAYDARSGKEIWWAEYDGYSVVPRPIVAHGLTFAATSYDKAVFYAIRMGGEGNVTDSHVAWSLKRGAPKNPSPLAVGDELYLVSDDGIASCLNIETGEAHWQKRLGGNFSASPLLAGGRIYFTDEDGKTTVITPGTTFSKVAENQIEGRTLASIAVTDGTFFYRTESHLYKIVSGG